MLLKVFYVVALFKVCVIFTVKTDSCTTYYGKVAECIPLRKCPLINEGLFKLDDSAVDFARKSICKIENRETFVCCGRCGPSRNGTEVDCIPLRECKSVVDDLLSLDQKSIERAKKSVCKIEKDELYVCCDVYSKTDAVDRFLDKTKYCTTPHDRLGECVSLNNCPLIYNGVVNLEKEVIDFARKSKCKEENDNVFVCCGKCDSDCVPLRSCKNLYRRVLQMNKMAIDTAIKAICKKESGTTYVCCDKSVNIDNNIILDTVVEDTTKPPNYFGSEKRTTKLLAAFSPLPISTELIETSSSLETTTELTGAHGPLDIFTKLTEAYDPLDLFTELTEASRPSETSTEPIGAYGPLEISTESKETVTKPSLESILPNRYNCGYEVSYTGKSYHRNQVNSNEFPWLAMVMNKNSENGTLMCLGTLISNTHVLTAASCLEKSKIDNEDCIFVRLGEVNTKTDPDCDFFEWYKAPLCEARIFDVAVKKYAIHPDYSNISSTERIYDIAVITLKDSVTYTEFIRPLCLPRIEDLTRESGQNIKLYTTGWGYLDNGKPALYDIKKKSLGTLVPKEQCSLTALTSEVSLNRDLNLCFMEGKNASCYSDVGAPLMSNQYYQYFLEGIFSMPTGQDACKENSLGVYTSVIQSLDWIKKRILD